MINYRKKYIKYNIKNFNEKKMNLIHHGGDKEIAYSENLEKFINTLISEDSVNNLKESVYSCTYINMTNMKKVCDPDAKTVYCDVLFNFNFPILSSSNLEVANCKIIEDKFNNNLVIIFEIGGIFYCDHFVKETFITFMYIYEILLENFNKKEYKYIHITGHSMGASISILFSYFIMIIEKSTNVNHMYIPYDSNYFSIDYPLTLSFDLDSGMPGLGLSMYPEFLAKYPTINIIYDKDNNFNIIKEKTVEFLKEKQKKEYTKKNLANYISICIVAPFPVLFRPENKHHYDEYKSFYNNRLIIFSNCENEALTLLPNINTKYCDNKPFNMTLFNDRDIKISELTIFNYVDINDLSIENVNNAEIKYTIKFKFNGKEIEHVKTLLNEDENILNSKLHLYVNNYRKLKQYVEVKRA
jgi:hypothetical protein